MPSVYTFCKFLSHRQQCNLTHEGKSAERSIGMSNVATCISALKKEIFLKKYETFCKNYESMLWCNLRNDLKPPVLLRVRRRGLQRVTELHICVSPTLVELPIDTGHWICDVCDTNKHP